MRRHVSIVPTGLVHRSKQHLYSITSSARTSNEGGTVRPSALAVFMSITRSNLVGCSTADRRLDAFEDLIDIAACTAEQIGYIGAVDDRSAIGELSREMNRGQSMFRRERDNSRGLDNGESVAKNNHCIGVLAGGRAKGGIELLGVGRLNYRQSHA